MFSGQKILNTHMDLEMIMFCSKCGYAVPKGQSNCVYCGTHVSYDAAQSGSAGERRSTGAFSKQIRSTPSEAPAAVKEPAPAGRPGNLGLGQPSSSSAFIQKPAPAAPSQPAASPFAFGSAFMSSSQQPSSAPSIAKPIVAPYARRPMYAAFDPNSEDSPFVRKPFKMEDESESEKQKESSASIEPEEKKPEELKIVEQKPADKAPEDKTEDEASAGDADKKKHGLSIAALSVVFVALVICWFINF